MFLITKVHAQVVHQIGHFHIGHLGVSRHITKGETQAVGPETISDNTNKPFAVSTQIRTSFKGRNKLVEATAIFHMTIGAQC